jgi:hypothetical protein
LIYNGFSVSLLDTALEGIVSVGSLAAVRAVGRPVAEPPPSESSMARGGGRPIADDLMWEIDAAQSAIERGGAVR